METGCCEGELAFPGIVGGCKGVDQIVEGLNGEEVGKVGDEYVG